MHCFAYLSNILKHGWDSECKGEVWRCVVVSEQMLDVPTVLTLLRQQRMMMVQTLSQYTFIYKVLIQFLRNSRLIWDQRWLMSHEPSHDLSVRRSRERIGPAPARLRFLTVLVTGQVWRTLRRALFIQYYSQMSLWAFTRDRGRQSQHFYFAVHRREWRSYYLIWCAELQWFFYTRFLVDFTSLRMKV